MVKVKIRDIASLRMGYPFRSKIERDSAGTVGVIQMKDIDHYNRLDLSDVYQVNLENFREEHLLQHHDILFRSRGVSYGATLVTEKIEPFVAASPLIVIRVQSNNVIPQYLAWYLNQPYGQYQINRLAEGSSQLMVSKSALETVDVDLPPIAVQKAIAEIAALSQREQQIRDELTRKRKVYIDTILMRQAKLGTNENNG